MERDESWNEGVNTAANIKIYHITWIQNSKKNYLLNNNKAIPQTSLTFYTPKIIILVHITKMHILHLAILESNDGCKLYHRGLILPRKFVSGPALNWIIWDEQID